MTLTDEELYEGFTKEQIERYKREVREMYDPMSEAMNQFADQVPDRRLR